MQRVISGDMRLVKIADPENPSDFLTKWVSGAKFAASLAYVTGSRARPTTSLAL